MAKFIEFSSINELNERLATQIVCRLKEAVEKKGHASLAVSGGKTPLALFKLLSKQKMDWSKVYITLADERWVSVESEDSNERLVRQNLLQNEAKTAHFIGLKNSNSSPFEAATEIENDLKTIPMPFDVVVLGVGDDGHTASLFPGAENLRPALDMHSGRVCMGMTPLTASHDRMTLTLPAILNSQRIFVQLVSQSKKAVYEKALSGDKIEEMPIRSVLHQEKVPVDIYWAP